MIKRVLPFEKRTISSEGKRPFQPTKHPKVRNENGNNQGIYKIFFPMMIHAKLPEEKRF